MFHLYPNGFLQGHNTQWHHTREIITLDCGEGLGGKKSSKAFNCVFPSAKNLELPLLCLYLAFQVRQEQKQWVHVHMGSVKVHRLKKTLRPKEEVVTQNWKQVPFWKKRHKKAKERRIHCCYRTVKRIVFEAITNKKPNNKASS